MEGVKRILSLDGGGIKGVLPAAYLATLEDVIGKRVVEHFDLIAGTSTGGILALGISLGLPAVEILDFYKEEGPSIFGGSASDGRTLTSRVAKFLRKRMERLRRVTQPKYNPKNLRAALERAFGQKTLGDCKTRVVIPAFNPQRRSVYIFKTAHHQRLMMDWKTQAVDVALATSAAPTYFRSHSLRQGESLLDGGVWANNPVGLAVVEAVGLLGWNRDDIRVLSLGCTEEASDIPENTGVLGLLSQLSELFLAGQSHGSLGTAKLLLGDENRLVREQHVAPRGQFQLDAIEQIKTLQGIGSSMARDALPKVESMFFFHPRESFNPVYPVKS